jgi:para-aminobenzoate synthetase component 1
LTYDVLAGGATILLDGRGIGDRERISAGDVYQVNACRILTTRTDRETIAPLFAEILVANPAPLAAFLRLPNLEIASASPELFIERDGSRLRTSPMKGTKALGGTTEFGEKDIAENLMIVDLMRNDLGKIAKPGSVQTSSLFRSELHHCPTRAG